MADIEKEWQPPTEMTIGPLCWKLGEDGRYAFLDGAIGGRYQCGVSESLLVKRLAAALEDLDELTTKIDALQTCEAWLQKQVAERDAELAELRKTAAALMEIAASGADPLARRRMLDAMAMDSFAENG